MRLYIFTRRGALKTSKPKYLDYSYDELKNFVLNSCSFEEVLVKMHYTHPNDKRFIDGLKKYFDKIGLEYDNLPNILNSNIIKCVSCGQEKPVDDFYFTKGKLGQRTCKECVQKKQRAKYHFKQDWLNNYKSNHPCEKCGCSKFYLLDFHHLDPAKKDYAISDNSNVKIETLMMEIDKCIVLCSNCHREFHYFEKENGITIDEYLYGAVE